MKIVYFWFSMPKAFFRRNRKQCLLVIKVRLLKYQGQDWSFISLTSFSFNFFSCWESQSTKIFYPNCSFIFWALNLLYCVGWFHKKFWVFWYNNHHQCESRFIRTWVGSLMEKQDPNKGKTQEWGWRTRSSCFMPPYETQMSRIVLKSLKLKYDLLMYYTNLTSLGCV